MPAPKMFRRRSSASISTSTPPNTLPTTDPNPNSTNFLPTPPPPRRMGSSSTPASVTGLNSPSSTSLSQSQSTTANSSSPQPKQKGSGLGGSRSLSMRFGGGGRRSSTTPNSEVSSLRNGNGAGAGAGGGDRDGDGQSVNLSVREGEGEDGLTGAGAGGGGRGGRKVSIGGKAKARLSSLFHPSSSSSSLSSTSSKRRASASATSSTLLSPSGQSTASSISSSGNGNGGEFSPDYSLGVGSPHTISPIQIQGKSNNRPPPSKSSGTGIGSSITTSNSNSGTPTRLGSGSNGGSGGGGGEKTPVRIIVGNGTGTGNDIESGNESESEIGGRGVLVAEPEMMTGTGIGAEAGTGTGGRGGVEVGEVERRLRGLEVDQGQRGAAPVLLGVVHGSGDSGVISPSGTSTSNKSLPNLPTSPTSPSPAVHPSSSTQGVTKSTSHDRRNSLYSQWAYDFEDEEGGGSESDGEVYGTPSEGLSEVVEGDEEEDEEQQRKGYLMRGQEKEKEKDRGRKEEVVPPAYSGGLNGGFTRTESGLKPPKSGELTRATSSAHIERASVVAKPDMSSGPRVNQVDPSAFKNIDQEEVLQSDILKCKEIIHLFLTSRMREAETLCKEIDPDGNHLYIGNAGAVVNAIKAMMTFDVTDLKDAFEVAKTTSTLAHSLRKPQGSMAGRLAGFVRGGTGVAHIKTMSTVEKHAELVYAETLLIKAVLGIVAGGDWVGLIKEALNMRAAYGIYRTLQQYLDTSNDPALDNHFKSGVQLGTGLSSLMLSLLPGKVMKVAELFGYAGDREVALRTLMASGEWEHGKAEPGLGEKEDGIRRPIADMGLLTFHTVISFLMPVSGVDIHLAEAILNYNMKRFPNGIFFMYFQSRLLTLQARPEQAVEVLQNALMLKLEYIQLQHICLWDLGVNNMVLCHFNRALGCFKILSDESSWSKAVYIYSQAACMAELSNQSKGAYADQAALDHVMEEVPKNMKKIAGKSLPIEKFVSRKARKYLGHKHLILPGIELAYIFGSLANSPPRVLYGIVLPKVQYYLDLLDSTDETSYEGSWGDDYCLANFLLGVILSFSAFPHVEAIIDAADTKSYPLTTAEASGQAEAAFRAVLSHAGDVHFDHWILYHACYELARLYSHQGKQDLAIQNLEMVLAGKPVPGTTQVKGQGKYSLESALMLKAYAGLQAIKEDPVNAKMH